MPTDVDKRFYRQVSASSSLTDTYVPANGKTVIVTEIGGSGGFSPEVKVEVRWDDVPQFSTHGDMIETLQLELVADGVKSLDIVLTNDSSASETIGAHYLAWET